MRAGAWTTAIALVVAALGTSHAAAQPASPRTILFGVAYYDEYSPYDRLDADVRMMQQAGINVVRIGESGALASARAARAHPGGSGR